MFKHTDFAKQKALSKQGITMMMCGDGSASAAAPLTKIAASYSPAGHVNIPPRCIPTGARACSRQSWSVIPSSHRVSKPSGERCWKPGSSTSSPKGTVTRWPSPWPERGLDKTRDARGGPVASYSSPGPDDSIADIVLLFVIEGQEQTRVVKEWFHLTDRGTTTENRPVSGGKRGFSCQFFGERFRSRHGIR